MKKEPVLTEKVQFGCRAKQAIQHLLKDSDFLDFDPKKKAKNFSVENFNESGGVLKTCC